MTADSATGPRAQGEAASAPAMVGPIPLEAVAWIGILALAAALRLPDLAGRGTWDADQGHDMLVLRDLVVNGQMPLLGPPTSIGAFHHGVLYYVLLAPAALVSGADPIAVTTWIALGGIAAVAITGWLARSIAGPLAGLVAGLLLAVSSSAVEESIFIWNPNVIALTSSIALAAAWRAHVTGRARWWVLSGAAAVATMHGHVLGVILTPVIAGLIVVDWRAARHAPGDGTAARRIGLAAVAWLAIAALSYVPLAIHELGADGSELRALAAFVAGGGGTSAVPLPIRLPIVLVRVLGWPLGGLITAAPLVALLTTAVVVGTVVWRGWSRVGVGSPDERLAVRWLGLGLGWAVLALAVAAPSLASVVPGLPNDHYHAFADPIVVTVVAIGVAALARMGLRSGARRAAPGAIVAAGIVVGLVTFQLATQPPATAPDGGWRAAEQAAARILGVAGDKNVALESLPAFKSAEAVEFPLERLRPGAVRSIEGSLTGHPLSTTDLVLLCDQLFREAIGAGCGGPAEDARMAKHLGGSLAAAALLDRFEAAPGRWISIYAFSLSR